MLRLECLVSFRSSVLLVRRFAGYEGASRPAARLPQGLLGAVAMHPANERACRANGCHRPTPSQSESGGTEGAEPERGGPMNSDPGKSRADVGTRMASPIPE